MLNPAYFMPRLAPLQTLSRKSAHWLFLRLKLQSSEALHRREIDADVSRNQVLRRWAFFAEPVNDADETQSSLGLAA